MKTHELKCHPAPFAAVMRGEKTFEFRKDDRGFEVGDKLKLREWIPEKTDIGVGRIETTGYTGLSEDFIVTYKLAGRFGVPEGYCVLGIRMDTLTAKNIAELEAELDEVTSERDELAGRLNVYDNLDEDDFERELNAAEIAALPSIELDQFLADLHREVRAVGGVWPV